MKSQAPANSGYSQNDGGTTLFDRNMGAGGRRDDRGARGVDRTTDAVVDRHRQIAAGATLGAIVAETVEVTTTDAVDLTTAEVDIMTVMEEGL